MVKIITCFHWTYVHCNNQSDTRKIRISLLIVLKSSHVYSKTKHSRRYICTRDHPKIYHSDPP